MVELALKFNIKRPIYSHEFFSALIFQLGIAWSFLFFILALAKNGLLIFLIIKLIELVYVCRLQEIILYIIYIWFQIKMQ